MRTRDVIVVGVLGILAILIFTKFGCNPIKPPSPPQGNTPVAVTPTTDPAVLHSLPALPNNEHPVSVIPVPTPKPNPGVITTPNVVVSDQGNTFVVYTDKIDWGFRFDPKASVGISSHFVLGLDVSWFTYWRFNADALFYCPIKSDLDFGDLMGGLGISYQLTNNTSAGAGYLKDLNNNDSIVLFVSLKF